MSDHDATGYAEDDEISTARLAYLHDVGKMCGECGASFTHENGKPSCCSYCKRRGSELPESIFPETTVEAFKAIARKRKAR